MLGKVEVQDLPQPAGQVSEFAETRAFDGRDGLPLLTRQPNFAPHYRARQRRRPDHKDEMLKCLRADRVLDLAPPVPAALERDDVLPD